MKKQDRLSLLGAYFNQLRADVAARGAFSASGDDPIETTIRAALGGAGAVGKQFWEDVKVLGGTGAVAARSAVEAAIASAAEQAARKGVDYAVSKVASVFTRKPGASAQREVGRKLMEMGRGR